MNPGPSSTPGAHAAYSPAMQQHNTFASGGVPGSSSAYATNNGASAIAGPSGTSGVAAAADPAAVAAASSVMPGQGAGPDAGSSGTSAGPRTTILSQSLELKAARLARFRPAKVFADAVAKGKEITSLSYDAKGEWLITAGEDDVFNLYNCKKGRHQRTFYSKKYGIDLARFTHKPDSILHASTKAGEHHIRFHSLSENTYISYFKGHESRVSSLQMSPVDDTFMSAAANESVRLWDLRSSKAFGKLRIQGHAVVAYDSSGQVIAIALNERSAVVLYDIKNFEKAPFLTIHIDDSAELSRESYPPKYPTITYLEFAPGPGNTLLVGTSSGVHYLVDAFDGSLRRRLTGGSAFKRHGLDPAGLDAVNAHFGAAEGDPDAMDEDGHASEARKEEKVEEEAGADGSVPRNMFVPSAGISGSECCFTPDGKFILSGSASGQVFCWSVPTEFREVDNGRNLEPCAFMNGHQGPSRCVAFNPRTAMLTTAGRKLAFWLPDLDEDC